MKLAVLSRLKEKVQITIKIKSIWKSYSSFNMGMNDVVWNWKYTGCG